MAAALINLTSELPAVGDEPKAARTGVWTIRPDQALRWARRSPAPSEAGHEPASTTAVIRAIAMAGAVLVAAVLGGVAAWALSL